MRSPEFWRQDGVLPRLLSPLSVVWGWAAERRQAEADPFRSTVPVICVGNIVTGGSGKTPVVLALVKWFRQHDRQAHVLTRGYGGTEVGPRAVDLIRHDAARVGDEPLLLAAEAPTWVARWRPDGAVAAQETGAEVLIMDDGFQNPSIAKDLSLVVVDGGYGFGNGRVMPAGPCRERIADGLARADAVVLVGDDTVGVSKRLGDLPILRARLVPGPEAALLAGRKVIGFAGIGRPDKFFGTLAEVGAMIEETIAFPDHHPYTQAEIEELIATATAADALLVTTAKDMVRVPAALRDRLTVLPVTLAWDDEALLATVLDKVL